MNTAHSQTAGAVSERSWMDLFRYWDAIPFLAIHVLCLFAIQTGVRWEWVGLAIGSYYVRMVGVTAGYHRYFSHRSFKTGRVFQFLLAFVAMTSAQKGVLWWAAHHRHHHKYSDREEDFHSPLQRGFWFSHVGWILSEDHVRTDLTLVKDLKRYPELQFLDRFYFIPPLLYAGGMYVFWGFPGLVWGFFISTTALYHCTFFINSLTHLVGTVRYRSGDGSRNNVVLAILCCGEGWHNNHHHYQSTANQGWFWWEVDFSYYVLIVLSWLGLVWDLRTPPPYIRAATIAAESLAQSQSLDRRKPIVPC
ncbi:Fatty acid desaturase, type 1 [Nitrospira sp. KM1]|uniref:acyl-CoA desaturase n=1 Tax=Nitrospira sp. KM1 TaxID=1936990 RepID=UPI0013A742A2|nr:acyl-CoA desaturase [Nitrospira sp. KM1]BCA55786.1 Fatty acid desaturase, type 1 [Nitrospira sp. KM1]